MSMNPYIVLGHTVNAGVITDGLKLQVIKPSEYTDNSEPPARVRPTLNGRVNMSFGVPVKTHRLTAYVLETNDGAHAGYATKADVDGFNTATTVNGRLWKFQDIYGTIVDALLTKCVVSRALPGFLTGSNAWFAVELEIVKRA